MCLAGGMPCLIPEGCHSGLAGVPVGGLWERGGRAELAKAAYI